LWIEVIQETSYDGRADIWSLGITMIELCEGQPPHYNVHPMRAIFMIPMKPAPTLKDPTAWSVEMVDFLTQCLQKNPEDRATSEKLLEHQWIYEEVEQIRKYHSSPVLKKFFDENIEAIMKVRNGEAEEQDEKQEVRSPGH
jgi:serine/threonine protein kinase